MDKTETTTGWYSEDAATFGDRLAGAREAYGFSQKELAQHIGVKEKTVHAWEDDLSEPRANRLQMLSGVLNVSMRWLLTGQGVGLGEPEAPGLPAEVTELLTELREIRGQAAGLAERVGRVEKSLRATIREKM